VGKLDEIGDIMLVLVVEDMVIIQVGTRAMLTKLGHEVAIASTGEAALEMADKTKYDVIFMDIGLGDDMNGLEATQKIKESGGLNATTPVVAVTAHVETEFMDKAAEVGIVEYVNKPLTRDKITTVFERIF